MADGGIKKKLRVVNGVRGEDVHDSILDRRAPPGRARASELRYDHLQAGVETCISAKGRKELADSLVHEVDRSTLFAHEWMVKI